MVICDPPPLRPKPPFSWYEFFSFLFLNCASGLVLLDCGAADDDGDIWGVHACFVSCPLIFVFFFYALFGGRVSTAGRWNERRMKCVHLGNDLIFVFLAKVLYKVSK